MGSRKSNYYYKPCGYKITKLLALKMTSEFGMG